PCVALVCPLLGGPALCMGRWGSNLEPAPADATDDSQGVPLGHGGGHRPVEDPLVDVPCRGARQQVVLRNGLSHGAEELGQEKDLELLGGGRASLGCRLALEGAQA